METRCNLAPHIASRLVMAGVDLRTVQELMGHKTIQMTVRYAHLASKHQLAAVRGYATGGTRAVLSATKTDTGAPVHLDVATPIIN